MNDRRKGQPQIDRQIGKQETVLYLHIPKTGGTSLSSIIYDQYAAAKHSVAEDNLFHAGVYYFPGSGFFKPKDLTPSREVIRALGRADLRVVVGHFWFGIHEYVRNPCRYITLLRDPVERVISLYYHLNYRGEISLEEFVTRPPYREVDNDQTRRIAGREPEVGECSEEMLEIAKQNLMTRFDAVGLMERFDESLEMFRQKLHWTKPIYRYESNTNPNRKMREDISERAIRAVRARNELDCKLYEFASSLLPKAEAEAR